MRGPQKLLEDIAVPVLLGDETEVAVEHATLGLVRLQAQRRAPDLHRLDRSRDDDLDAHRLPLPVDREQASHRRGAWQRDRHLRPKRTGLPLDEPVGLEHELEKAREPALILHLDRVFHVVEAHRTAPPAMCPRSQNSSRSRFTLAFVPITVDARTWNSACVDVPVE